MSEPLTDEEFEGVKSNLEIHKNRSCEKLADRLIATVMNDRKGSARIISQRDLRIKVMEEENAKLITQIDAALIITQIDAALKRIEEMG